jgi:hypothetical protein
MRLQALAESMAALLVGEYLVQSGFVTSLQPSLDLTGLTLTSVAQNLCVDVSIISTSFPGSGDLPVGVPAPLTVRAGLTFTGGGTPLFSPPLQVVVDAVGATPAQRVGFTNSTGNFQTTFTPQTNGMGLSVLAAFVDATHPYLSNAALTDSTFVGGAVVVTPSQTTIAPGASRQFSAVVEGASNQAVTWSVTGGGGSITQTGLFASNGTPGTFFVTATSVANPDSVGVAQVTVTGSDQPCVGQGCLYSGIYTFRISGGFEESVPSAGAAGLSHPLISSGRVVGVGGPLNYRLRYSCGLSNLETHLDITVENENLTAPTNFTGAVTIGQGCSYVPGTPVSGTVSAGALTFTINAGSETLSFEGTRLLTSGDKR